MLLKLLIAVLLLYCAVAAALFFAQTSIFFPTRLVPPAGPLPPGAERIEVTAPDGVGLEGVLIKPLRTDSSETAILGFAGNASNAAGIAEFLHALFPDHPVIAFHYRGYGPSGGKPSAAALLEDAPLLHDLARERLQPEKLVVVGISLGSGVAAGLAARRPVDGLILVTPFDSLKAVAREQFPWLPVSLLLRHDLASDDYLRNSDVPVAIVAAERDEVIPPRRTAALRQSVGNLVFSATIPGTQHNTIAYHPRFAAEMHKALEHVIAGEPGR
ncbi:MAG TPA: alpha/beta fold hydrolase [Allosphingosinicella sp.]|nr:alpha/beta fold hydrolase [Allosphingosinicella sp.]